ncbi:hypothetical protein IU450_23185 [Nocardia abscessus]|uniref:hypothetical protein n=1 Tax=Nocardia abscessus TaxID=120957 RepID=UPI0018931131|nr:hypothetical protein [Nocardia abscessus]MBF6338775.1 hypothetical protein [Nocardia abscessus]
MTATGWTWFCTLSTGCARRRSNRESPVSRGTSTGTIELPSELLTGLDAQPATVRDFVRSALGGDRFTDTPVDVTDARFHIGLWGLTLNRS